MALEHFQKIAVRNGNVHKYEILNEHLNKLIDEEINEIQKSIREDELLVDEFYDKEMDEDDKRNVRTVKFKEETFETRSVNLVSSASSVITVKPKENDTHKLNQSIVGLMLVLSFDAQYPPKFYSALLRSHDIRSAISKFSDDQKVLLKSIACEDEVYDSSTMETNTETNVKYQETLCHDCEKSDEFFLEINTSS